MQVLGGAGADEGALGKFGCAEVGADPSSILNFDGEGGKEARNGSWVVQWAGINIKGEELAGEVIKGLLGVCRCGGGEESAQSEGAENLSEPMCGVGTERVFGMGWRKVGVDSGVVRRGVRHEGRVVDGNEHGHALEMEEESTRETATEQVATEADILHKDRSSSKQIVDIRLEKK